MHDTTPPLPYKVNLYLEMITRLVRLLEGLDTNSPESKKFVDEIERYLDLISHEIEKAKEE